MGDEKQGTGNGRRVRTLNIIGSGRVGRACGRLWARAQVFEIQDVLTRFKRMQSKIAITAAAHSHAIELGFLMLLLAFVQRYVMLADAWRLRWARVLAIGAWILPVCVLLATRFGLRAAAFSDLFGGFVLAGLAAMAFGLVRHTGAADASAAQTP